MESEIPQIEWGSLLVGVLGGLALFLYGMDQLSNGLKAVAGERMKALLGRFTTNRFLGATTGAGVTAIIQSSSVTTVLTVGFVAAGLMTLPQALSVIMGANIGTTITAQIIAFKVTELALPLVTIGVIAGLAFRQDRARHIARVVLGLGLVFFGLAMMSEAVYPLRSHQGFVDLMARADNPLIGLLVGAMVTAVVQSSSATTGLIIVLAGSGLVSLPAGIALAIGANVGTCVTALLAAIGKPRAAVQVALSHVLFNVAGGLLWIGLTAPLASMALAISPEGDVARQIAMAHTIFNVSNALIFIGLTGPIAVLLERVVPKRPTPPKKPGRQPVEALYLQTDLLEAPSLALEAARMETVRLGERVRAMLSEAYPAMLSPGAAGLLQLADADEQIDDLHEKILDYLRQVGRLQLDAKDGRELVALIEAVNHLEHIGDVIESDLVRRHRLERHQPLRPSPETRNLINRLHRHVVEALDNLLTALREHDAAAAKLTVKGKAAVVEAVRAALDRERDRLLVDEADRVSTFSRETEMVEQLRRIYGFVRLIGKAELSRHKRAANDETDEIAV